MAVSDKAKATRQRIIAAATELFYLHGYNATGLDKVIAAAEVTKGNFYYHFKSKEVLAAATLQWQFDLVSEELTTHVFETEQRPIDRLFAMLNFMANRQKMQYQEGYICGCYFGNFTLELSTASIMVRNKVTEIFDNYVELLTSLLLSAQEAGEVSSQVTPQSFAPILLSQIEGAILLDKAQQEPEHVDRAIDFIRNYLQLSAN